MRVPHSGYADFEISIVPCDAHDEVDTHNEVDASMPFTLKYPNMLPIHSATMLRVSAVTMNL